MAAVRVSANDISDSGIIVGGSSTTGSGYQAFIYQNGMMTKIESLTEFRTEAIAVNNLAQVIGSYSDGTFGYPFLWDSVDGMRDLNTLLEPVTGDGWTLLHANDINNQGQIVGEGFHNGVVRAYLLTPGAGARHDGARGDGWTRVGRDATTAAWLNRVCGRQQKSVELGTEPRSASR